MDKELTTEIAPRGSYYQFFDLFPDGREDAAAEREPFTVAAGLRLSVRRAWRRLRNERPPSRHLRRASGMVTTTFSRHAAGVFPASKLRRFYRLCCPGAIRSCDRAIFFPLTSCGCGCCLDRTHDQPTNERATFFSVCLRRLDSCWGRAHISDDPEMRMRRYRNPLVRLLANDYLNVARIRLETTRANPAFALVYCAKLFPRHTPPEQFTFRRDQQPQHCRYSAQHSQSSTASADLPSPTPSLPSKF